MADPSPIPQDAIDAGAKGLSAAGTWIYEDVEGQVMECARDEIAHAVLSAALEAEQIVLEAVVAESHDKWLALLNEEREESVRRMANLRAELAEAKAENERAVEVYEDQLRRSDRVMVHRMDTIDDLHAKVEDLTRRNFATRAELAEVTEQRDRLARAFDDVLDSLTDACEQGTGNTIGSNCWHNFMSTYEYVDRRLEGWRELLAEDWVGGVLQPNFTDTVNNPESVNNEPCSHGNPLSECRHPGHQPEGGDDA